MISTRVLDDRFSRAVLAIVDAAGPKATVSQLTRSSCVVSVDAIDVLVLRAEDVTDEALRKLLHARRTRRLDLVLVGGDASRTAAIKRARPMFTPAGLGLAHLRDDGTFWKQATARAHRLLGANAEEVARHLEAAVPTVERLTQLTARAQRDAVTVGASQQALTTWAERIQARRPTATWALAAAIAVVFAMQLAVGFSLPPQLLRMGALSPNLVADGEVWRLLSCTMLHGGVMHFAFNTYVLIALGSFLERVIGAPRLVVLYVGAAIAGSLGSAFFLGERFSVGASGAVWGLLGAHAMLAFRGGGLVPDEILPGAKRAAMINLGLNVANSFQPHVDMAAHFAGGIAGAVIFVALRRGLPHVSDPPSRGVPAPTSLVVTSGLCAALLVGAMGVALVTGDVLALDREPSFERVELSTLGISIELPEDLEQNEDVTETGAAQSELVFGSPLEDAAWIGVLAMETPPLDPTEREAEVAGLITALGQPTEGMEPSTPERFEDGGDPGVRVQLGLPNGLVLERAFLLRPGRLVRVEAYRWPELAAAPAGLAERVVRTARLL